MPELSVHLCVKDRERTVGTAVRSTLAAMPRDAELFVLDDGSTDATLEVVQAFRDKRIRVLHRDHSVGPPGARRVMLARTDSAFVATIDSDDVTLPWRFGMSRRAMAQTGADLLFTQVVHFVDQPRVRLRRPSAPVTARAETVPLLQLIGNNLYNPTLFAHRRAIEDVGGYRDCVAEDYDLWLRALVARKRLVRWGVPGVAYRLHPGQVSIDPGFVPRTEAQGLLEQSRASLRAEVFGLDPSRPPSASELWAVLAREARARRLSRLQWFLVSNMARATVGPPDRA